MIWQIQLATVHSNVVRTTAIVNVEQSTIDREANHSIYIKAGPEIAVASTKCFTGQLSVLISISIILTEINNPKYKYCRDWLNRGYDELYNSKPQSAL